MVRIEKNDNSKVSKIGDEFTIVSQGKSRFPRGKIYAMLAALEIEEISSMAKIKILQHEKFFVDGVDLGNLPAGFFTEASGGKKVLKFDENAYENYANKYQVNSHGHPYVLRENDGVAAVTKIKFEVEALEEVYEFHSLPSLAQNIVSFLGFEEDVFFPLHLDSLAKYGLLKVLESIKMQDQQLYEHLKKNFFGANGENLSALANLDALMAMEKIMHWPSDRKNWWMELVERQQRHEPKSFLELHSTFSGFSDSMNNFWQELYGENFTFPYPYALGEPINNMFVALTRIEYVLKHAAYPREQLGHLEGMSPEQLYLHFLGNGVNKPLVFCHREMQEWKKR